MRIAQQESIVAVFTVGPKDLKWLEGRMQEWLGPDATYEFEVGFVGSKYASSASLDEVLALDNLGFTEIVRVGITGQTLDLTTAGAANRKLSVSFSKVLFSQITYSISGPHAWAARVQAELEPRLKHMTDWSIQVIQPGAWMKIASAGTIVGWVLGSVATTLPEPHRWSFALLSGAGLLIGMGFLVSGGFDFVSPRGVFLWGEQVDLHERRERRQRFWRVTVGVGLVLSLVGAFAWDVIKLKVGWPSALTEQVTEPAVQAEPAGP